MHFKPEDVRDLPTLNRGHFADLKIETPTLRVWLMRTEAEEPVLVERLRNGRWENVTKEYQNDS